MNTARYNRQLHPEEKTIARQLADKSGGKYPEVQIEDQMRIMGVSVNEANEAGALTTLIGQMPTDSGAQWISSGTTADGELILTQETAQADRWLQSYILSNYKSASSGQVPSQFTYALTDNSGSINVTGPFTKFDQYDAKFMRDTTVDAASAASTNAGRVSAAAGAAASIPGAHQPAAATLAAGSTMFALAADAVAQILKPDPVTMFKDGIMICIPTGILADRFPMLGPVINEIAEKIKGGTGK